MLKLFPAIQKHEARRVYLTFTAATALLNGAIFTAYSVYVVTVAHLDPLQLVLAGTALELAVFIFEVPTGVIADVYSRRLSVVIGYFIIGLGFFLTGLIPSFWPIILGQVLWGLGYTFTSGASQAWISDEIGEVEAGQTFIRVTKLEQITGLVGVGLAVALAYISTAAPIILGGILYGVIALYLLFFMPENGFHPTPAEDRSTWQRMFATFRGGLGMVKQRPALGVILGVGFFFGLYSEGYDRLSQAHMLERFDFPELGGLPLVGWFGLLTAAGMILTALATAWLEKRELTQPRRLAWTMIFATFGIVISMATFALTHSFALVLALNITIRVLRHANEPLYLGWVNHRLDPQVRATVISMSSLVDALGQIAGGPLVGIIAQRAGIQTGLLSSTFLLTPVIFLLISQIRLNEK